jgi:thiamine transporter
MSEPKFEPKVLAEIAIFAALSAALYTIRPFSLPYGGAITAGSMVPILWLSLRRGARIGMFAGAIFGAVALEIDVLLLPYSPITNPVQVLFEYPFAFGLIGAAGLFRGNPTSTLQALIGTGVAILLRFFVHFTAGILFWWWSVPEGWNIVAWSAVYNGSFLSGEFIISAILIYLLVRRGTLKMYL